MDTRRQSTESAEKMNFVSILGTDPFSIMIKNSIQAIKKSAWKHWAMTGSLFVVGAIVDYYVYVLAAAMTGAGHGIYIPVLVLCGPVGTFMWPLLIAGANSFRPSIRISAKAVTCIFYLWLLIHFREISNMTYEYHRTERAESLSVFWMWAVLVVFMHSLIWLPIPLIRIYEKVSRKQKQPLGQSSNYYGDTRASRE